MKKGGKRVFVQCNGDPITHKCEERNCRHRKIHVMRGCCGKRLINNSDRYCTMPETKSSLEIGEDGGLVTCIEAKM